MFNLRYLEIFCWVFVITTLLQLIGDEYALGFILTLIFIYIFLLARQIVKISFYHKTYDYILQYKKLAKYSLEICWIVTLLEVYYFYCITRKCNHYLYHTGTEIGKILVKRINRACFLLASVIENFKSVLTLLIYTVQKYIKLFWSNLVVDYNLSAKKYEKCLDDFECRETEQYIISLQVDEEFEEDVEVVKYIEFEEGEELTEDVEFKDVVENEIFSYLQGLLHITAEEGKMFENKIVNYVGMELSEEVEEDVEEELIIDEGYNVIEEVEEEVEEELIIYNNTIFEALNS